TCRRPGKLQLFSLELTYLAFLAPQVWSGQPNITSSGMLRNGKLPTRPGAVEPPLKLIEDGILRPGNTAHARKLLNRFALRGGKRKATHVGPASLRLPCAVRAGLLRRHFTARQNGTSAMRCLFVMSPTETDWAQWQISQIP